MLTAHDILDDKVTANVARRVMDHFCPSCGEPVVLKRGAVVAPHFAHRAGAACSYGKGETALHRDIKYALLTHYRRKGAAVCEAEYWHAGIERRSDVYVEDADKKICFEVQVSGITAGEVRARTLAYGRIGVTVCWIVPLDHDTETRDWKVKEGQYVDEPYNREKHGEVVRWISRGVLENDELQVVEPETFEVWHPPVFETRTSFPARRINVIERYAFGKRHPKNVAVLHVKKDFDGTFFVCDPLPYKIARNYETSEGYWEYGGSYNSTATYYLIVKSTNFVPKPWF